jgi:hypothetical protein
MRETILQPRARTEGLVINDLTDEVLVYDLKRDQAHCLNHTAAAVWKLCDGQRTAAQIAAHVSGQTAGASRQTAGVSRQSADGSRQEPGTGDRRSEVRGHQAEVMTEQMVWLALEQLGRDHLLEERMKWPAAIPHLSRREVMRLGLGAAIAVPIIVSISAPLPAQAGTCKAKNANCSTGAECCSKACVANKCA